MKREATERDRRQMDGGRGGTALLGKPLRFNFTLSPPPPPTISLVYHSIGFFLIELIFVHSMLQLLVTINTVPSSLILFALMMEVIPKRFLKEPHNITSQKMTFLSCKSCLHH
jgi:hypothetical protein